MKNVRTFTVFFFGFAALMACVPSSLFGSGNTAVSSSQVVVIDGTTFSEKGVIELAKWRYEEKNRINARFETEFRNTLSAYTGYLRENFQTLDVAVIEAMFEEILLLHEGFCWSLSALDETVRGRLGFFQVEEGFLGEAGRAGAFRDFFSPSFPSVTIDGVAYNALAVYALQEEMKAVSVAEWAAMAGELSTIINRQFNIRMSNVPTYTEWYWSFGNTIFGRPWNSLWGTWEQIRDEQYNAILEKGVDADAHLRATMLFKAKSELLFTGIFYALELCAYAEGDEEALSLQRIMGLEDFFGPYTLTSNVARAGAVFGLDTSAWRDNYSRLTGGIEVASRAFDLVCIVVSIATLNPLPIIIDVVFGLWDIIAYPFTTPKKREQMNSEIQQFLNGKRATMLGGVGRA